MAGKHRRSRRARRLRLILSVAAIVLLILAMLVGVYVYETRMTVKVENAGEQVTSHTQNETTAQVFMNGQWYRERQVETMLVVGLDTSGAITGSDSYNNSNQADFLVLYVRDLETGEHKAIHINRDTMTDITMLGVTGEAAGTRFAQLALAYNYGRGEHDSSKNTASAVSNLLYGRHIDHYITVTMDAVPILNDWAGGITVEVLEDMPNAVPALVKGEKVKLTGDQALAYTRTRMGLQDSTNMTRMERQRQYASAWLKQAPLNDSEAVFQLIMQMDDYHHSDCTAEKLAEIAEELGKNPSIEIFEVPGEAVQGSQFIEYYVDEEALQQLVLELFYVPVEVESN